MSHAVRTRPVALFEPFAGRSLLIDQACRLLGVSKRTIYYWIRAGRLETVRTRGGSQRILVASIQELAGGSVPPGARVPDGGVREAVRV